MFKRSSHAVDHSAPIAEPSISSVPLVHSRRVPAWASAWRDGLPPALGASPVRGPAVDTPLLSGRSGDQHEHAAAAVAERVASSVDGAAHTEQHGFDVSGTRARAPASETAIAPEAVQEVLRSPGRAIDAGVRRALESAFGQDFGDVRIHTDASSAASARAISARGYTIGQDIAFAEGAYAPHSPAGLRLLAHELAHVVQSAAKTVLRVHRSPEEPQPTRREIERDRHLRRLAVWPREALDEWRRLNSGEQTVVVLYMTGNYGSDFAQQFLTYASQRRRPQPVINVTNIFDETPQQLRRRGLRPAGTFMGMEHWVHPSGNELWRILPSPSRQQPAAQNQPQPAENLPHIDPSANPETVYGPRRRAASGVTVGGQTGRATQYTDGTIVVEPEGSRAVTYRPRPDSQGAYDFYDENGDKVENVSIVLDPDEVFGGARSGGP